MSIIHTLQKQLENKSIVKYKGQSIDVFSGSAILTVYNALNDANKVKYANIAERDILKAASIAFKLTALK